ncbi:hypothetical protein Tco_0161479 [Tanacetum coccineum]
MSKSNTHQQSLADAVSETRPPMLERGSYIPWASRFRRYLNRKRENKKWLNKDEKRRGLKRSDLKHYEAEIEAMNLILISIPNDIYNYVDACKTAKSTWQRVERLMRRTVQNKVDSETRFNNEFDQFVVEPSEVLVSVYNLVDYDEDYQGDAVQNNSEDLLTSTMILLARDRVNIQSRNSRMMPEIQDVQMFKRKSLRVTMFRMMLETYKGLFEPRLQERLQMFNATIVVRKDLNFDNDEGPSYDSAFLSEFLRKEFELLVAAHSAMPRNYRIGVVKIEGPKNYYSWRFGIHVLRSSFKVKVPMNMYPCKIVEKVSFDCIDGKIWDKLETVVTKDGKTTVYPWKLKQLTKEEEEEEKERTKAFKEEEEKLRAERMIGYWKQVEYVVSDDDSGVSTARSMPLRDEEDPIEYGSDAGSTGSNMP